MPVKKLPIPDFLQLSTNEIVLDVRSPSEYNQAHIPGAYSLPLFSDEERKIVGTAYKQRSREQAIKAGLDYFGPKMRAMVETVEGIIKAEKTGEKKVYIHCWRGGMRSSAVAWLLDLYGFEVSLLVGGYKAYRNWVLAQFEKEYPIRILGGFTGSGKTQILQKLKESNEKVIDLEGLANHKGSAFGGIGQPVQPRQEMFENLVAMALQQQSAIPGDIWLEDESQRIGILNIPPALWITIRRKKVFFVDIPFEERLKFITQEYGSLNKESLKDAIIRIQKKLGPLESKTALTLIDQDNYEEGFKILLQYYDKLYLKALNNREDIADLLCKITCTKVNPETNTQKILACDTVGI